MAQEITAVEHWVENGEVKLYVFEKFFGTLESNSIAYLAYGGVAVGVWGDPRETQDVDAVVAIDESDC